MKRFRTALPCVIAGLLLAMSIAVPIVLSEVQDKTLLQRVKTEPISQDTKHDRKKTGISILERLNLMGGGNTSKVSSLASNWNLRKLSLKNEYVKQILQEAETLQARGGFPAFDLRKGCQQGVSMGNITYVSYKDWNVSIMVLSVSASDAVYEIWADADTYTIYQYDVKLKGTVKTDIDYKTVSEVFSDYLSINTEQFQSLYSFSKDGRISLDLK